MGALIQAGGDLVATAAAGGLNQYYGNADTTQTTVTATSLASLSTVYTIPAGEAYSAAAYELWCGGTASWGTASEHLQLAAFLNSNTLHTTVTINDTVFASGSTQVWKAHLHIVCVDGISEWMGSWTLAMNQVANNIVPGTAADNTVTASDSSPSVVTASVASAITVQMKACWTGSSGSPFIDNNWTIFRKVS